MAQRFQCPAELWVLDQAGPVAQEAVDLAEVDGGGQARGLHEMRSVIGVEHGAHVTNEAPSRGEDEKRDISRPNLDRSIYLNLDR